MQSRAGSPRVLAARRPRIGAAIAALSTVVGLSYPVSGCAEWFADLEAGVLYDSNLGNAQLRQDIRSDTALTLAGSAGHYAAVGEGGGLSLAAELRSERYGTLSGMSNGSLGGTVSYQQKFGLGDAAPWIRFSLSQARLQFSEDVRNGWRSRAAIDAGRRIGERWTLHAQYLYERRTADHAVRADPDRSGAVFDQKNHGVVLEAQLALDAARVLSASYSGRRGDVASSTLSDSDRIDAVAKAETPDPAFGPGASAYKLHAVVHAVAIAFNQAMGRNSSLNLSCQRIVARGDGGNDYYKNIGTITFLYSF